MDKNCKTCTYYQTCLKQYPNYVAKHVLCKFYENCMENKFLQATHSMTKTQLKQAYENAVNTRYQNGVRNSVDSLAINLGIKTCSELNQIVRFYLLEQGVELVGRDYQWTQPGYYNICKAAGKKVRETFQNKTPEEKAELVKKTQTAIAQMTDEEYEAWQKKKNYGILVAHSNRTEEAKAEYSKKVQDGLNNRSPEEKAEASRKMREACAERTPGQIRASVEKWRESIDAHTEEEREEWWLRNSKSNIKAWINKTPEEKAVINKAKYEGQRKFFDNMSEELKAEYSERTKQWFANATEEEKAERSKKIAETIDNRSSEEKEATTERRRASMIRAHKNMSPETKAEVRRKLRAWRKTMVYPKQTYPEYAIFDYLEKKHADLQFEHTSVTNVRIGRLNPDFLSIKHKAIIEFYGCYWHGCPDCFYDKIWYTKSMARIRYYKKQGYKVLVIWGHEFFDRSWMFKIEQFVNTDILIQSKAA